MPFSSTIKGLVSTAMKIADDLAPAITYQSIPTTNYNPTTGTLVEQVTNYTVKAVLTTFRMDEKDSTVIVSTDLKCLIAAADLPVTPTINDKIVAKGKTWNVLRVMGVPGDSLHILHVREV